MNFIKQPLEILAYGIIMCLLSSYVTNRPHLQCNCTTWQKTAPLSPFFQKQQSNHLWGTICSHPIPGIPAFSKRTLSTKHFHTMVHADFSQDWYVRTNSDCSALLQENEKLHVFCSRTHFNRQKQRQVQQIFRGWWSRCATTNTCKGPVQLSGTVIRQTELTSPSDSVLCLTRI